VTNKLKTVKGEVMKLARTKALSLASKTGRRKKETKGGRTDKGDELNQKKSQKLDIVTHQGKLKHVSIVMSEKMRAGMEDIPAVDSGGKTGKGPPRQR